MNTKPTPVTMKTKEQKDELIEGLTIAMIEENNNSLNNNNLLPCPFCGGKVIEVSQYWNMANAKCEDCKIEWGHCGSKYEGRYDKWNKRYAYQHQKP